MIPPHDPRNINMFNMKKRTIIFVVISVIISIIACSNSDKEDINNYSPQQIIIGKWKLIYDGDIDVSKGESYLFFYTNGKLRFERNDAVSGKTYAESSYDFENDWNFNEEEQKLHGHILCSLYEKNIYTGTATERYSCWFIGNRMMLLPDMNEMYFRDPTLVFTKVNK